MQSFTVAFWFYGTTSVANQHVISLLSTAQHYEFGLHVHIGNTWAGRFVVWHHNFRQNTLDVVAVTQKWIHFAVTYDYSTGLMDMYVDGELHRGDINRGTSVTLSAVQRIFFGAYPGFFGSCHLASVELRLSAATAEEVRQGYEDSLEKWGQCE